MQRLLRCERRFIVLQPSGAQASWHGDLPSLFSNSDLEHLIEPYLHGAHALHLFAHCGGIADHLDMFVDEMAVVNSEPMNVDATAFYRRALLEDVPGLDPGKLPFVAGTAIIFDEKVWN